MEQFIKKWIIIFNHMTIQEQLYVFLIFLSPFIIFIMIQLLFQTMYKKYRIHWNFNKMIKIKKMTDSEVQFLKNLLVYLNQPIQADWLKYDFHYWRLVFMYTHRATERKESIQRSLRMIQHLKELGQKLFGRIPNRYFSTLDLPLQLEMTLEFPGIKRKSHGFLTDKDDQSLVLMIKDLPTFYTALAPHERVELVLIDQSRGLYFIQSHIQRVAGQDHTLLYLQHSIHILFRNLRRYERLSLAIPLEMKNVDQKCFRYQKILKGRFLDISRGGAKVVSDQTLKKGESYSMIFRFGEKIIELPACVVEQSYDYQQRSEAYHFKFYNFSHKNKADLSMILFKLKEGSRE